jgi:hypothetical protein
MSLYPDDMTKEEVMKEFARLIAPTLRKMYDEYEQKEKEQKEKKENEEKNEKTNEKDSLELV